MAGDERSHQVKAAATEGYNCVLYYHFLPLSVTINKVSLANDKRRRGVCERNCVRVWAASNSGLIDREQEGSGGGGGSRWNCYSSGQRPRKSRGRRPELSCFCCRKGLCYSEPVNRSCQGIRANTCNLQPTWSGLFWGLEEKKPTSCFILYEEVILSGSSCCYLVSSLDLFPLLRFLVGKKKTTRHLDNNVLIYLLLRAMVQMLFLVLSPLSYYLIRGLAVWSPSPSVSVWRCPRARHWTLNCQWMASQRLWDENISVWMITVSKDGVRRVVYPSFRRWRLDRRLFVD